MESVYETQKSVIYNNFLENLFFLSDHTLSDVLESSPSNIKN